MFTEPHIEALLADEVLSDKVWELWDAGEITDDLAPIAWILLATQTYWVM